MLKKCFLIAVLLYLGVLSVCAQQYGVKGAVVDSLSQEAIPYATVGLMRLDSTVVASSSTDETGHFHCSVRNAGKYILKVSYIGYKSRFVNLDLSKKEPYHNLARLCLVSRDQVLQEAVIKTILSRVEQREDTTVFNAGAYRVPKGSTLEALIRQLPGVEIKEDGSISWNGKKINELLVNGKDFFQGDNTVALKNLPTDFVSKIKTYDKKSDYTEQTGIDDGEEKTVMDISTKAKLDHSWISNVDLSYGTEDRYSAAVFASRFTEKSRVSAYASLGNLNPQYGGGSGLTSTKSGGVDFSWKNDKKKREAGKLELGGSLYYNYSGTDMVSTTSSETFLASGATSSFANNANRSSNSSSNFGAYFRLAWNPDTLTSIRFRPSFSHGNNDNEGESLSATFNGDPYQIEGMVSPLDSIFSHHPNEDLQKIAVNRNAHSSMGKGENNSVNGELSVVRRLNSEGRNLSLKAKGSFRKSESEAFSLSKIYYFNGKEGSFLNQYSEAPSKNWDYNLRFGYAEPLGDKWVAETRYSFGMKFNDTDKSRYHLDRLGGVWADPQTVPPLGTLPSTADSLAAVRDLLNSQYATYKYYDHIVDLGLQYKTEDLRFNIGVELNPEKTKMAYNRPGQHIDTLITRDVFQVIPDARFRYRFSKEKSLDFRYRGHASQPSMTNLLAVVDNSNPLHVSMGNPGLKPSWTNSVSLNYGGYNAQQQQGIYTGLDYTQTGRMVSNLLVYNESTGVRYTRPENINGNWGSNSYFMMNMRMGKEKFFGMSTYTSLNYRNDVAYVSSFVSESDITSYAFGPDAVGSYDHIFASADIQKNTTRTLGINERLKFFYQKQGFDIGLHGGFLYNHSASELQGRSDMNTWMYDYGTRLHFDFDWGLSFTTDMSMSSRRGYSDATMNTDEILWNAQLSYSFLKERAATVSLQYYDILHQKSNVSRRVDATQRSDSWTNGIHSYCMIHLIYKLNIFPGKELPKKKQGAFNMK